MSTSIKRRVLITGSNDGVGLSLVKEFLGQGFYVVALYHKNCENLSQLDSINLEFHPIELEEACVKSYFKSKQIENVDILINNAGIYRSYDGLLETSLSELRKHLDVNLMVPFELSKYFISGMKKRGWGRIVNVSSIGVKYGGSLKSAPYTISKAGLEALTQSFAKYAPEENVLVNAIRLGVTDTKIHSYNQGKNMKDRVSMIPVGRMATPEEIAKFVAFLCSEENTFTTGQVIPVSGGE